MRFCWPDSIQREQVNTMGSFQCVLLTGKVLGVYTWRSRRFASLEKAVQAGQEEEIGILRQVAWESF